MLLEDKKITVAGRMIRIARLSAEGYEFVHNPEKAVHDMRNAGVGADLFTFTQKLPDTTPKYDYPMEWDNVAAIPVTTFDNWWTKQINDKTRNMVRRAGKKGVDVKIAEFDDEFVGGISGIYNESKMRQGKPFWHYGKVFETVKKENQTFLDRSYFIGAYYDNELIGFIKLVCDESFASMMQIISMIRHRDKAPTNALVSKAVEVCATQNIPYLVYAKFAPAGRTTRDSLADFKHHNGFKKIDLPRYYVPLTFKGQIALKCGFHSNIAEIMPESWIVQLKEIRRKWHERKMGEDKKG